MNQHKLFGTDGIRGHVNFDPMTVEKTLLLGKALAVLLKRKKEKPRVVIGKDTRLSGYMFENALIAGLSSMGVDTLMTGPLPTPGIAYITRAYRADAGVVISASHNSYSDNGIKIFNEEGFKLSKEDEEQLELLVSENRFIPPSDDSLGKNTRIADADGRYIEFLKASFPRGETLEGVKIVLDCAHGAAHRVAPLVFWELNAHVTAIGVQPTGKNINAGFGSLYPEIAQNRVVESRADVGITLDGDADRLIMIDEKGEIVDGDQLLALCAVALKEQGALPQNTVVGTVMTNLGVIRFLEERGIKVLLAQVGDRHVLEQMVVSGALLGGEQSGHLIFLKYNTTGDGILSALQVLRMMCEKKCKLSELTQEISRYPQILLNVPVSAKPPLETLVMLQTTLEQQQELLGSKGRILVRYSGTEPICRILVEGEKKEVIEKCASILEKSVKQEIGSCVGSLDT